MRIEITRVKSIHIHFHATSESLEVRAVKLKGQDKFRVSEAKTPFLDIKELTTLLSSLLTVFEKMEAEKIDSIVITIPESE